MAISLFSGVIALGVAMAQAPATPPAPTGPNAPAVPARPNAGPVVLDWVPPVLAQLSGSAVAKESFTFDRTMLEAAAGLLPDSDADVKQTAAKLDGVSVHLLRFAAEGTADPESVDAIREAYHLRGWKHVVSASGSGGPVHDGASDVWVVMDGVNVRGAVVLIESPKSLTLVTVAGEISPVDLLHLRGHFGIPRFDGDGIRDMQRN